MEQFIDQITAALVAALVAILTALASYAIAYIKTKTKLVSDTFLREIARSGIALAEEKGAVLIKTGVGRLLASEKLTLAIQHVIDRIPNVSEDEARRIVESELPKVGLGAASTLSALARAAQTPEGQ